MEKGQPFRKALTWRPAQSGVEGLRSKPNQQEKKTGHQDPRGESKPPGQSVQDASGPGLKGKVSKAHLAPHGEEHRSRGASRDSHIRVLARTRTHPNMAAVTPCCTEVRPAEPLDLSVSQFTP